MSKKYCYLFTEGNAGMRELLGGKGANLAEMTNIGLPVPQGFTITIRPAPTIPPCWSPCAPAPAPPCPA